MRALVIALLISIVAVEAGAQTTFTVINAGSTAYTVNGTQNATIQLTRGVTYTFNVNASGHPFYIKTARVTGTGSQYTTGVTGNGTQVGSVTFAVPMNAPDQLFYQCGIHSPMGGTINIVNPVGVGDGTIPNTAWLGPAKPNPTREGALFRFGLPRRTSIEFAVFDARGRKVRNLANTTLPAGEHSVAWNGRDRDGRAVASGVYYFRLRVEDRVLSGRVVMAR